MESDTKEEFAAPTHVIWGWTLREYLLLCQAADVNSYIVLNNGRRYVDLRDLRQTRFDFKGNVQNSRGQGTLREYLLLCQAGTCNLTPRKGFLKRDCSVESDP